MSGALLALAGALLVPGQRAEFELPAGAVGTHTIELEAGQFVRLAVVQQGQDLVVALVGPDGTRTEVDAGSDPWAREPLSILAVPGGTYRTEVRSADGKSAARYVIESEAARPAADEDRVRVAAERALAEAAAFLRK